MPKRSYSGSNATRSRTVRVFLSSTFRDFGEERDLLVRQVFPALRAKLKTRMVELVDVDLRWVGGIMYVNGEIEETGVAAGVLGHPAMGVAWLANKLGSLGTPMEPGHIVLAGSFTRVVFPKKGDTLHADFGQLGGISVRYV